MVHNCAILTCPLHNRRNIRKGNQTTRILIVIKSSFPFVNHVGFLFHSFPVDQHRFELWRLAVIKYCSRTLSINKHSKICHRHFRPDDYIANHTGLTRYLKATAIPTIFNDPCATSIRPYLSSLTIDSQQSPSLSPVVSSATSDPKAKRLLTTIDKLHQIQNANKSNMASAMAVEQDSTKSQAEESVKADANNQNTTGNSRSESF